MVFSRIGYLSGDSQYVTVNFFWVSVGFGNYTIPNDPPILVQWHLITQLILCCNFKFSFSIFQYILLDCFCSLNLRAGLAIYNVHVFCIKFLDIVHTVVFCWAERHNWTFCGKSRAQDKVAGHGAAGSIVWWWVFNFFTTSLCGMVSCCCSLASY